MEVKKRSKSKFNADCILLPYHHKKILIQTIWTPSKHTQAINKTTNSKSME
jgi:hypothetical protein